MEAIIQYGCNYTVWKQSMSLNDDTEVCKLLASDEAKQSLIPAKPDRLLTSSKHFLDLLSVRSFLYVKQMYFSPILSFKSWLIATCVIRGATFNMNTFLGAERSSGSQP